ncbi:sensor histidine kinase [Nocardia testacea]|uniref:sensor histidine kinase n=1 Tax=Nocardia testacea TaxID=248551 RepID=UPI0033F5BE98
MDTAQRSAWPPDEGGGVRTRWFGLWDGYLAVAFVVASVFLVTGTGASTGGRTVAVVLLVALVPWYIALGRPAVLAEDRARGALFAAGLLMGFAAAVLADPAATFALFAVAPLLVMSLPFPAGSAAVLLAHLWPLACAMLRAHRIDRQVLGWLPYLVLGAALATVLGLFVSRVVDQSRERAEMIDQLRYSRGELARLSHESGVAAERDRLAREIHDTLAQSLTSISALVQAADADLERSPGRARRHLDLARRAADESLAEARAFVADRTPPVLARHSLVAAVAREARAHADRYRRAVDCSVRGTEAAVATRAAVVVLRAVQESLTNIAKHAPAARTVTVVLDYGDDHLTAEITDDGPGFDTARTGRHDLGEPGSGHGVAGARTRAAAIGGRFEIRSAPGQGTTVRVTVPFTE